MANRDYGAAIDIFSQILEVKTLIFNFILKLISSLKN
jgi:hypothetical protein